jgi:hypothetical protein
MVTQEYREANELADVLDFELETLEPEGTEARARTDAAIASLRADLAKQERIDGKPADPASQRRGFTGAI